MSTKKRPTDDQLEAMLTEPHFGASRELQPADPIVPTPMVLPIDEVDPYDRNPRIERNRAYDVIKENIRKRGFKGALSITRRPGAERYMAAEGGNTTLVAIKELYEETGDQRFATIQCIFEPWVSETTVLIAHLIENDARDDLIFIDKARAVRNLKHELEAETGTELSQRKLVEVLRERGYPVSRRLLYSMDYAVDTLLSAIPVALRSGMGRPQVNAIQKLESAARDIWDSYQAGDEELFKAVFAEALARCDGPDWSFDTARSEVEAALAEHCGSEVRHIGIEMGSRLSAATRPRAAEQPDHDGRRSEGGPEGDGEPAGGGRSAANETEVRSSRPESAGSAGGEAPGGPPQGGQEEKEPTALAARSPAGPVSIPPEGRETRPAGGGIDPAEATAPGVDPTADMPTEIRALRRRSYELAKQLAERNDLFNIVLYVPVGFGYLIADVPPLSKEDPPEQFWYKTLLWWHLAACIEMETTPVEIVRKCLMEDSVMRQVIETQSLHPLQDKIVTPPPSYISSSLWSLVNEEDWRTVLDMMQTYRAIRKLVDEKDLNLWGVEG